MSKMSGPESHRNFPPNCSSAQRRMCGGGGRVAVAAEAGESQDETVCGGVPGHPEGRSAVQQLLAVPGAGRLYDCRRQHQPSRLVQILGQKGGLRTARTIILRRAMVKRRGTPVVTAPPARIDLNRDRLQALKILWLWPVSGIDTDQPVPVLPKCTMPANNSSRRHSDIAGRRFIFYR